MSASVRRSSSMLRVLAPAATRPVPASTVARAGTSIAPRDPITKPTSAVSITIKVILGLTSST
jgi:hypothetical protein